MSSRRRWTLVVSAAAALDLLARFGAPFDFARIMHIEAVLFPLTALALGFLFRSEPRSRGWRRGVRLGLLWAFALGGVRAVLWTLRVPLVWANRASLLAALTAVSIWLVRRRRRARDEAARSAA